MNRIPEPELMEEADQALAYAQADFSIPHNHFVSLFAGYFPTRRLNRVLDLGCGTGDVLLRFARAFPEPEIHGLDGSSTMLEQARMALAQSPDLADRVRLIHQLLPGKGLPYRRYDTLISNSLLHHLHDPQLLWDAVLQHTQPGSALFIMDLMRPNNPQEARELVETYSGDEPAILKTDFFNSLCAAFTLEEIEKQLQKAGLTGLCVQSVSDRHLTVHGVRD
ncbi:MAG: class I SAM-dependent methyltransferase [Magnetococcales bacterium]|nr:class I SAM-dependent methyltransferase [Magnetococcales bacterium]